MLCPQTPSWDGVLCQTCRDFFDQRLSPTGKGDYCIASGSQWIHTLEEIEACAGKECKLCRLIARHGGFAQAKAPTGRLPDYKVMYSMYWDDEAGYNVHIHYQAPVEHSSTELERLEHRGPYSGVTIEVPLASDDDRSSIPEIGHTSDSPETLSRIRDWLRVCQDHDFCNRWAQLNGAEPGLPKRLIHIDGSLPTPRVVLVSTRDLPLDLHYATLSHCWGSGSTPLKLHMHSLQAFEESIPWLALPATFQDALQLVLSLDINYLWIDALCIVQDNIRDWSVEAASMAKVYANAVFNISADHAVDSTVGLFSTRDIEKSRPFVVPCTKTDEATGNLSWFCYAAHRIDDIFDAPLNQRAWVVQERFLARSVVHFTASQVYWECAEWSSCESFPLEIGLPVTAMDTIKKLTKDVQRLLTEAEGGREVYDLWDRVSHVYALGALTLETDRAVAISGIARVFCHHLKLSSHDYLCGLFRPRFIKDLLWARITGIGQTIPNRQDNKIPSWSWLSVSGGIWRPYRGKPPHRSTIPRAIPDAILLEARSLTDSAAPFGAIKGGWAELRSALCHVQISVDSELYVPGLSHQNVVKMCLGGATLTSDPSFHFMPDDVFPVDLEALHYKELYLMLGQTSVIEVETEDIGFDGTNIEDDDMASSSNPSAAPYPWAGPPTTCVEEFRCLLLEPGPGPTEFRRIGLVCFGGWNVLYPTSPTAHDTMAAEWANSRAVIEQQFRSSDVPPHLYEAVDEDMMYTIKLV